MKNIPFNLDRLKQNISNFGSSVFRYHLIISFIAVSSFLIFSVITVNAILSGTHDAAYAEQQQASAIKTRFDDTTIQKINELRSREENPSLDLPSNVRRNPFKE